MSEERREFEAFVESWEERHDVSVSDDLCRLLAWEAWTYGRAALRHDIANEQESHFESYIEVRRKPMWDLYERLRQEVNGLSAILMEEATS